MEERSDDNPRSSSVDGSHTFSLEAVRKLDSIHSTNTMFFDQNAVVAAMANDPRLAPRRGRQTTGSRPLQTKANIREISIFLLEEKVKNDQDPNYVSKYGEKHTIKKKAKGGTGKEYSYLSRYVLLLKDEAAFVGDSIGEDYANCRLKVVKEVGANDGMNDEDDAVVGDYRLSDFQLYYKEPTSELYGNHATEEAIRHNIMPVFEKDVDMHTPAEDRTANTDPLPNPQFLRLLLAKAAQILAITDLLDMTNKSKMRERLVVILNRFFLTKCDKYLPQVKDGRFDELLIQAGGTVAFVLIVDC